MVLGRGARPVILSSRPVLARLTRSVSGYRRRMAVAVFLRACAEALACLALLIPGMAALSAFHPYTALWLRLELAAYALGAWPAVRLLAAWRRGHFQAQPIALALDSANPNQPDIFRTLLSLENHGPETLEALNRYYADFETRLVFPAPRVLSPVRLWTLLACLASGMAAFPLSGRGGEIAARIFHPGKAMRDIPIPEFELQSFPKRIALGEPLHLRLRLRHIPRSETVYAEVEDQGKTFRYPLDRQEDVAEYQQGPVTGNIRIRFTAMGSASSEYVMQAVSPPHLSTLSAIIRPPAYTHTPPETLAEFPASLSVLPGSDLIWKGAASEPLAAMWGTFKKDNAAQDDTLAVSIQSGTQIQFQTRFHAAGEFRLHLTAKQDGLLGHSPVYRLEAAVDANPEIAWVTPAADQPLNRSLQVPVVFQARDDFGVSRVRLLYAISGGGVPTVPIQGAKDITAWMHGDGLGGGVWDLSGVALAPGNTVEATLEATDNDVISGPKSARSQTLHLRMPSLEEVAAQVKDQEQDAESSLRRAAEREERLEKEAGETGQPASPQGPPPLSDWDIERILSTEPRQHLQRLRQHLAEESGHVPPTSRLGKELLGLEKEAGEMEKRLPNTAGMNLASLGKSPAEQKRELETLMRDQEQLRKDLADLQPLDSASRALAEPLSEERTRLAAELHQHQQDQKDLHAWMENREAEAAVDKQKSEQAAKGKERVQEDVRQALEQMKSALQKGLENGTLSPEVLEKMQRIRELLKEALPDSMVQQMQRAAENQQVGLEDVQRNLKEMLQSGQDLREGLDRAIHMLEAMRTLRDLENLSEGLKKLEAGEHKLAEDIARSGNPASERSRQAEMRGELQKNRQALEQLAQKQDGLKSLRLQNHSAAADQSMRAVEQALQSPGGSAPAEANAKSAAQSLHQASAELESAMQGMRGGPGPEEIAEALQETLEFGRWLDLLADRGARIRAGWEEDNAALYNRVAQVSQWLRGFLDKLAARRPYESEALRREIAAIGFLGATLGQTSASAYSDSLQRHTRRAARELLKWLASAQNAMASGSGQGGKGSPQAGGGSGDGTEGMAGRLRGISGKQMAVNQATEQLLQSLLQNRGPGSSPGRESGGENSAGGKKTGPGGLAGESEGGQSPRGQAGNAEQQVGEALERLSESAGDGGGAARKLRQLAEEARDLENALRRGRTDASEIKRRQDRFQTRLLEAAHALEQRGQDQKREAEAFHGALPPNLIPASTAPDMQRELKRRRDWARSLSLTPEQKRRVEWYYENLLTR